MADVSEVVLVVPAFEPGTALVGLVNRLKRDFRHVIVVDDGSRGASKVFAALFGLEGVKVLTHKSNRGKGAALKTGFKEALRLYPQAPGVVTVDADGQHLPEDVVRVAEALLANPTRLIVGTRAFSGRIPFRSRLGNLWTRLEFRLLTGVSVRDTQSGLRGIPRQLLPRLMGIGGDRYDYEIRVLADCAIRLGAPVEIPITTVYVDGNRSSHYRPLADTWSTQRALFAARHSSGLRGRRVPEGGSLECRGDTSVERRVQQLLF